MPNVDAHGYWLGKSKSELKTLGSAIQLFKLDNGRVPSNNEGLSILVELNHGSNLPNWKKYMERLPKDYWENEYIYRTDIDPSKKFQIYSAGPDGIDAKGLEDDVVLWEKQYDCKIYKDCLNFKEKTSYIAGYISMFSLLIIFLSLIFQLSRYSYRKIKDNNAINSAH